MAFQCFVRFVIVHFNKRALEAFSGSLLNDICTYVLSMEVAFR